jgi:sulfite dehydrogenase (quinone) subunit SoeC
VHPAFSVIVFTVSAGAGYGLMMFLVLAHLSGFAGALDINRILLLGGLALVLITIGLISSTFHLANPKNAWRAFSRFRTSWLSREGVFAVLTYPSILAYLFCVWYHDGALTGLVIATGVAAAVFSLITIFTTGMIYACLKTIRQWNTALTPANYILLGLMLGTLIFTAIQGETVLMGVALGVIGIAALMKAIYFFWIGKPTGPSINTATGFTRGKVRLLDVGHTAGTFLTDEFGYRVQSARLVQLRYLVFLLGFIVPAALLGFILWGQGSVLLAYVAMLVSFSGVIVERWLFFAEARHVVNLYHGMQRT